MSIAVESTRQFASRERFDPLTDPGISLFHVECRGGSVGFEASGVDDKEGDLRCADCGRYGSLTSWEVRAALRRVLVDQGAAHECVGAFDDEGDWFDVVFVAEHASR